MAYSTSRTKSNGPVLSGSSNFNRSTSPSGRFCASSFASSSSFTSNPSTGFFTRPSSPTRVSMYGHSQSSSSVRFSIERSSSPTKSFSVSKNNQTNRTSSNSSKKRTCMCSPTTHPGSFRCSLHKNVGNNRNDTTPYQSNRLNARRSAMTNSLVRICGVEGDLVKRALAALIRPSSHHQKRREGFERRPSRLSVMSKAEDDN